MKEYMQALFGGVSVRCRTAYPDTDKYFKLFINGSYTYSGHTVFVSDDAFKNWESSGNKIDSFAEFCLLCQPVSEELIKYDRCIFHAAALKYRDHAVLIAGGSGAGKSTHVRKLIENHPDQFSVINGDKPVLECTDKYIMVHPSPWNGKEGLYGAEKAPLSAVFFIKRDGMDMIETCSERVAAIHTFPMVFQSFETEEIIRNAAAMTEKIVKRSRCFTFHTNNIDISSELLSNKIKELIDNDIQDQARNSTASHM